jgi:imidazole glycerol-phosphate synthase subunit HisH
MLTTQAAIDKFKCFLRKFPMYSPAMVAIIDYQAGNLTSVERALEALGVKARVTASPEAVAQASWVVFPGVGAAGKAMHILGERHLDQALRQAFARGVPILGICLGAQIILDRSDENDALCLGLMSGRTRALPVQTGLKIPHMGWNRVEFVREHPVFQGLPPTAEYYFVHSYYPDPAESRQVVGLTEHGSTFPSVVAWRNLVATQFHPEKSGRFGLKILANFLAWDGSYAE